VSGAASAGEAVFRAAPPPALAELAVARLLALLPKARLVGGAVRDTLAGRPVADLDLATPERPETVSARLAAAGLRVIPTGLAHGTVTALAGSRPVEITTLRRDVETDGRHATVAFTEDWREDAARRDFTINAMSMTPEGEVHDWFGGADDLAAGRVRFVGDPGTRIAEDRLRALRFFRFLARYGRGEPDPAALDAIAAAAPCLGALSAERVWGELKRILAAPDPVAAVAAMRASGVLAVVLPEASDHAALAGLVAARAPADPLLRLAALAPGDPAALAERLRLSGAEAQRLAAARGPIPPPGADDAALRRALADTATAALIDRAWLAEARGAPGDWACLRARLAALPAPSFPLGGADVVAAGIAPGPAVGAALSSLRRWWLEGGCVADRSACLKRLAALVSGH